MNKYIKIGFVVAGTFVSFMVSADEQHHPAKGNQNMMGDPAQMQQMMEKRMDMMKSMLKLNAGQERSFNAFKKQKNAMMKDMMKNKQAMMKNMTGMKPDKMGDMQDKKHMEGMQGQQDTRSGQMAMMQMMSNLSFEQRMKMMEEHGKKMLATSKAGMEFYNSLTSEQKKKLTDMPKQMKGMKKE